MSNDNGNPHGAAGNGGKPQGDARGEKKVKILVKANEGKNGQLVAWSYEAKFENGGGSNKGNEMKFDNSPGYYKLEFSLEDKSGCDLKFLQTPTDAMWVAQGADCPPPGPGNGGQIKFEDAPVGNKLTVFNSNSAAGTLCYALRFSGTRQKNPEQPETFVPPYVFDPIMINHGGGGGPII